MLTREVIKDFQSIVQAWVEGKTIQYNFDEGWRDANIEHLLGDISKYRIKPEPKYRPFKNQEECWNEMLKHQPFGWIRNNDTQCLCNIGSIGLNSYGVVINNSIMYFDLAFNTCNFVDGTPFGIKEE